MRPTVTIAIPTRNRVEYLRGAVASALAAAGPADQVVVSDNASSDGTAAYLASLRDPRVVVLRQTSDLGMVGNWNACLAAATSDCLVLLSDDDELAADAIDALAEPLDDPRVAFSYGRARVIDEHGRERTLGHLAAECEPGRALVAAWFKSERTLYPCALMMRRKDLQAIGGYDAGFGPFADVGAWLGVWASDASRDVAFTAHIVASYRVHDAALSTSDLGPGISGVNALATRFAVTCGPDGPPGFKWLRAHYVASALRRRARASAMPVAAYLFFLLCHLRLVVRLGTFGPYWRQLVILANPALYERRKRARVAAEGRPR